MIRRRTLKAIIGRLGDGSLDQLQALIRLEQGRGWGSGTVALEVEAARGLLGKRANEELVVVDVGANAGSWAEEALKAFPRARVHALEPSATAFAELTSRFAATDRISLHHLALGQEDGSATLYADAPASGLASLTRRRLDHLGIAMDVRETVAVQTLASWATTVGLDAIHVLKLDVEGHELEILMRAGSLLDSLEVIQFEFGGCNIDTRTFFQDYRYLLTAAGFRILRLGPRGLTPVPEYREADEVFLTTNYFAVR
jgi:FkbM family methyltransferase